MTTQPTPMTDAVKRVLELIDLEQQLSTPTCRTLRICKYEIENLERENQQLQQQVASERSIKEAEKLILLEEVKKNSDLQQKLSQAEAGLAAKDEALRKLKPDPDCPFCNLLDEPCNHCLTMARIQGQVASALARELKVIE